VYRRGDRTLDQNEKGVTKRVTRRVPPSQLEATVAFPLSEKKKLAVETMTQLWEFLDHSLNLKKDFFRASFEHQTIRLMSRGKNRYWFRVWPHRGLQIRFSMSKPEKTILQANEHGQLIFGFLNTLQRNEYKHAHIIGAFSSGDPKFALTNAAPLLDRRKLIQLSNKLKFPVKPVGQLVEIEKEDGGWVVTTASFQRSSVFGLFFHMTKQGVIPSDFMRVIMNECFQVGKEIKAAMSTLK